MARMLDPSDRVAFRRQYRASTSSGAARRTRSTEPRPVSRRLRSGAAGRRGGLTPGPRSRPGFARWGRQGGAARHADREAVVATSDPKLGVGK